MLQICRKEVDLALFDPNCKSLPASYPPRLLVTIKPGSQATDSECLLPVRGLQEDLSFPMALSLSARSPHDMHELSQGKNYMENISDLELISLFGFIYTQVQIQLRHFIIYIGMTASNANTSTNKGRTTKMLLSKSHYSYTTYSPNFSYYDYLNCSYVGILTSWFVALSICSHR